MKVALHFEPVKAHQQRFMEMLARGIEAHGDRASATESWEPADVICLWGEREPNPPWHDGPVLRLEAGFVNGDSGDYVKDRLRFISTGWNGCGAAADPIPFELDDSRVEKLGLSLAAPREVPIGEGTILVCRQHPADATAFGADFNSIVIDCHALASGTSYTVVDRLHPLIARRNGVRQPPLDVALEDCALCVTYSSTAGVEAVMRGVPTAALGERSMVADVAARSLEDPWSEVARKLDARGPWLNWLSHRQWTHSELRDGTAWEFLKRCLVAQSAH